ncbi:phage major capsid protein [Azospirillum argentinense]
MTRLLPHIRARLSEPLAILPAKLEEIGAVLASDWNDAPDLPDTPPAWYRAGAAAVVPIGGSLVKTTGGINALSGLTSYATIADGFRAALADKETTAVVLHIDSTGGEVAGVFNLADELRAGRGIKPIVAMVDEMAASAAYLLASCADRIVLASPMAAVGSIGVIMQHVDKSAADKAAGLTYTSLFVGARKADGNSHQPLSAEARERFMGQLQLAYTEFVSRVAANRRMTEQDVIGTEAGVFLGDDAIQARLADSMQTPDELLAELSAGTTPARARINMNVLTDPGTVAPPTAFGPIQVLEACTAAGFPELAAGLMRANANQATVKAALEAATSIEAIGASSGIRQPKLARQLAIAGVPLESARTILLDTAATIDEAIVTDTTIRSPGAGATLDNPTFRADAIAEALTARFDPAANLSGPARQFVGMSLPEIAREVLKRNGRPVTGMSPGSAIQAALHSTSDFSLLLSNFANKTLRRAYDAAPSGLKILARESTARDFKDIHRLAPGEFPSLEKTNEHGEFKHGSFGEAGESYRLATYGKIIGMTRQALVNDDLRTFSDMTRRIAMACAEFEAAQLAALINANPAMADGKSVFHADHGNLAASGGAIADTTLSAARKAMREQKGVDGQVFINTAPRYIVVGTGRETEAEKAVAAITPNSTDDVNPFSGLSVVVDPRLSSGANGGAWYIAGDPGVIDGIEYAYLDGARGPRVETENGFDYDGTRIKVALDFGCGWIDWRGWFKNSGN